MRKIEQQMIQAIENQSDWRLDNTQVISSVFEHDNTEIYRITVILHGSPIATLNKRELEFSPCGWCTPTTKSRLNALLQTYCNASIYQKNKRWYLRTPNYEREVTPSGNYFVDRVMIAPPLQPAD